jgi:hypothetical protein
MTCSRWFHAMRRLMNFASWNGRVGHLRQYQPLLQVLEPRLPPTVTLSISNPVPFLKPDTGAAYEHQARHRVWNLFDFRFSHAYKSGLVWSQYCATYACLQASWVRIRVPLLCSTAFSEVVRCSSGAGIPRPQCEAWFWLCEPKKAQGEKRFRLPGDPRRLPRRLFFNGTGVRQLDVRRLPLLCPPLLASGLKGAGWP